MSLEAAIALNTEALNKLTAALQAKGYDAPSEKPAPEKSAPSKAAAPKADKPAPAADKPATLEDVVKAAVQLGSKDRNLLVELNKKYNVAKATQIKPEQYAAFIAECQA